MKLQIIPTTQAPKEQKEKKIKFYRNPMDPSIHSDQPMKDSMGMDYVPVYESAAHGEGEKLDSLGRGSFSLSPEQMKLSGSKISAATRQDLTLEIRVPGRVLGGSHVSFQAFEQDLSFIKPGMNFTAETPALPGETLSGKISSIDSILDPMTRTVRVDGSITRFGKGVLRTESSLVGKFEIKMPNVLTIPESAVIHTGITNLVYVFDGENSFSPREVTLGGKAKGRYEIKSGLEEDEKISSGPNFLLDSESRIQYSP